MITALCWAVPCLMLAVHAAPPCPLDASLPPPTPLHQPKDAAPEPCLNQFQTNVLVCMACKDKAIAAESYADCLERAKAILRACQAAGPAPAQAAAPAQAPAPPAPAPTPTPPITFLGPRPPSLPFKMDFARPGDPPRTIELSPFPLGDAAKARLTQLLHAEMTKYPPGTLVPVSRIQLGGTLKMNNVAIGALQAVGLIFIAVGEGDAGAATDAHVARSLHHEVAHALLFMHFNKFDHKSFRAALPPGFAYYEDRTNAPDPHAAAAIADAPSPELLKQGLLSPWAGQNLTEDVSSFAELLFTRPDYLLNTFAADSPIGRKARIVRDFYLAIDPRFADSFAKPAPRPAK